jgi:Fructose-2,6-bisphosphatase
MRPHSFQTAPQKRKAVYMQLRPLQQILLILMLVLCHNTLRADTLSLAEAAQRTGTVVMIRHALAPGFGDPSHFDINRCDTQRNLDDRGRRQSKAIGQAMRDAGFETRGIISSPWCRCMDTAELMDLGAVEAFDGLSSFFQDHAPRGYTLKRLRDRLARVQPNDPPLIMVTHQVVISAITGQGTRSGGAVLYDPRTDQAVALEMPPTP